VRSGLLGQAVIGFTGDVPNGLVLYPLGSTVVIRDISSGQSQRFLRGHSDAVSCIAVSPSGRYVASGQVTYMGFQVRAFFSPRALASAPE
jgi:WD40 repeat protein